MRQGARASSISITGQRIQSSLRDPDRKKFIGPAPQKNPVMLFVVPDVPEDRRDWRREMKPCDFDWDTFITPDEDEEQHEKNRRSTSWHIREKQRQKDVARICTEECPFLDLCSRDAMVVAQDLAKLHGKYGRLTGVWAGVSFTGRENHEQYTEKLTTLHDQIINGENIPWPPSSSNPTTHPFSNASSASALAASGQN
ncbi:WhiB family transcription factor [Gordonia phage Marietta]|uniref:WhiB family transcription factor n=1 Tax=Gordonia phage Marietta TaxID=2301558 RepID=A0A385DRS1_9CAUD|nr:transcriptional regulator WhiB-like [Gordonia phage Marietta]AXQ61392.1 WhiB family transcription factor [Gordonia phage Marietta]QAU06398.1 WhiB family transcription factor [Gordonia phage WhoseManz]